jgi:hypothetical protein
MYRRTYQGNEAFLQVTGRSEPTLPSSGMLSHRTKEGGGGFE